MTEQIKNLIADSNGERNRLIENLPIIAMFGFMFLMFIPQIPSETKPFLLFGGLGVAIFAGTLSEWALKVKASEYVVVKATVRPSGKDYFLFVKGGKNGFKSKCIDPINQMFETTLELAEPIIYANIGKTNTWEIEHELSWETRMIFEPATVIYKGVPGLAHNKVAKVTIWEKEHQSGRIDQEAFADGSGGYVPRFVIAEAPRDIDLTKNPAEFMQQYNINGDGNGNGQALTDKERQSYEQQINDLKYQNRTLESLKNNEQQNNIRQGLLAGQASNAFMGAIGQEIDVGKLVWTKFVTHAQRYSNMVDAKKALDDKKWPKIGMWVVVLCLGLGVLVLYQQNPEFRLWVANNTVFVIIGIVAYATAIYMLRSKLKR